MYDKRNGIETGKNGLVPPRKWDDPFENFFLKCSARIENDRPVSLAKLHDSWFGQCWTLQPESDAIWRIYSKDKAGVRVGTTIDKLFRSFYDETDRFAALKYVIGKVHYRQRSQIERFLAEVSFRDLTFGGQIHGIAKTLCMKREEFSHEREVRLLFHDAETKYAGLDDPVRLSRQYH